MKTRRTAIGALVLSATQALVAGRPALAQQSLGPPIFGDAESAARAGELFRRGNALLRAGKTQEAYDAYRRAWDENHTFEIAANLGNLELALGKHRDAAEHMGYAIYAFPKDGEPAARERLRALLTKARAHVGTLTVRTSTPNAELWVDGRLVGLAQDDALYVDPGRRDVEARWQGHAPARAAVELGPGESKELSLTLAPLAPAQAGAPAPAPAPPPAHGKSIALIVGGYGIAGILAGVGTGLVVGGRGNSTLEGAGVASFVLSGLLALGTTVYVLVPSPRSSPTTVRIAPAPLIAADQRGLAVAGRW